MKGRCARPRVQRGLTLVELLVAALLGLLVLLVASALLVSASGNYRNNVENMRLQDGGRYGLELMAQAIRQAGFVNWDSAQAPPGAAEDSEASVSGLDAASISRNSEGIAGATAGAVNGSDVLALRYSGSGAGGNGDGSTINCAGFGVAQDDTAQPRGWSIFYVAADGSHEAELRCKYRSASGWGADAIVRGVDSFQVLYGLDTDEPADGVPNTYVNATALAALDAALVLTGAGAPERERELRRRTHWKRVCSVRIALLLHGELGSRPDSAPDTFDLFGKAYADAGGAGDLGTRIVERDLAPPLRLRARQIFVTTVMLRNRSTPS